MDHKTTKGALDLRSPAQPRRRGKNYLLAIAINDYQHCRKLNNAVLDVERFIEVLERRYNFGKAQIYTLFDQRATRKNIINTFVKLADIIGPSDNLVVYFSGHGRYHPRTKGYWVPVEGGAGDDDYSDYIKNGLVKSYLQDIESLHTFLIVDSCFSGSLFIDRSREKYTGERVYTEPSRWGLTSGKKEIVSDGRPGENSPFARALLDVLNKATRPPTVVDIVSRVLEKVVPNSVQTPMGSPLNIRGHQGGQFVFHFRADEAQDWVNAKNADTVSAYSVFLEQYPDGQYARPARQRLERLTQEQLLANAQAIPSLGYFIQNTSYTDLRNQAKDRLYAIKDEEAWQYASSRHTIFFYKEYLKEFGDRGAYIEKAKQQMATLLSVRPASSKKKTPNRKQLRQIDEEAARRKREAEARRDEEIERKRQIQEAYDRKKEQERQLRKKEEYEATPKLNFAQDSKRSKKINTILIVASVAIFMLSLYIMLSVFKERTTNLEKTGESSSSDFTMKDDLIVDSSKLINKYIKPSTGNAPQTNQGNTTTKTNGSSGNGKKQTENNSEPSRVPNEASSLTLPEKEKEDVNNDLFEVIDSDKKLNEVSNSNDQGEKEIKVSDLFTCVAKAAVIAKNKIGYKTKKDCNEKKDNWAIPPMFIKATELNAQGVAEVVFADSKRRAIIMIIPTPNGSKPFKHRVLEYID